MLASRRHRQPLWRTELNHHSKEILKSTVNPYRIDSIRSPHVRESKQSWILDSTLWIPDSRYWIPDFFCQKELGFLIPIFSWIPDSLSYIPYSKAQNSGFRVLDSWFFFVEPGFLILIVSGIPDFQNPEIRTPGTGFRIFLSVELGFVIPIFSGIPNSFLIAQAKIPRIPEPRVPYIGRY